MKKMIHKRILMCLTLLAFALMGNAGVRKESSVIIPIDFGSKHKKWYVGNDNSRHTINFSSINEALQSDDVQEGDTLQICCMPEDYLKEQTVSKAVVICGDGYDTTAPTSQQPLYGLTIAADGVQIMQVGISGTLYLNNNNITVKNCLIKGNIVGNDTSNENDNCTIHGCFITGYIYGSYDDGTDNWTLTNNIVNGDIAGFENAVLDHNTVITSDSYALDKLSNCQLTNNILYSTEYKAATDISGCTWKSNVLKTYISGIGMDETGNIYNETVEKAISCNGGDASAETYYTTTKGGYAQGAATDGTDCGAFGGSDPYKLCGTKLDPNQIVDKTPLVERLAAIDQELEAIQKLVAQGKTLYTTFINSDIYKNRLSKEQRAVIDNYYTELSKKAGEYQTLLLNLIAARKQIVLPDEVTREQYNEYDKQIKAIEDQLVAPDGSSISKYVESQLGVLQTYWKQMLATLAPKKWYVGYDSSEHDIDFQDFKLAMQSFDVIDGDTLFVCMKENDYIKGVDITKGVVVCGPGYKTTLSLQPLYQVKVAAEGAVIMNVGIFGGLYLNSSKITVKNCCVSEGITSRETKDQVLSCTIHGCFVTGDISGSEKFDCTSWQISNNIVKGQVSNILASQLDHNTVINKQSNSISNLISCDIKNNILYKYVSETTDCEFVRNIYGKNGELDKENKYCEQMSDFISCTGDDNTEAYYEPVGSALGYSLDGTDCGAFGGSAPYKLGGLTPYDPEAYTEGQIEPNDLLALRNLYERFNGENWTSVKWNVRGKMPENYPNVKTITVGDKVYVQEVNLEGQNVKGNVTGWTVYLPQLTYLNLRNNYLYGDITQFVSELSKLKTLDISYNMLSGLTKVPASVATLYKGYQNVSTETGKYRKEMFDIYTTAPTMYICNEKTFPYYYADMQQLFARYSIVAFDNSTKKTSLPVLYVANRTSYVGEESLNIQKPVVDESGYTYSTTWYNQPYVYNYEQDYPVFVISGDNSAYPALLRYVEGDANMDGLASVLDVQTTINDILVPSTLKLFNYSAANTYGDKQINVQDVVCTVNILLEASTTNQNKVARHMAAMKVDAEEETEADATLYKDNRSVRLASSKEVSALDIVLDGVSTSEVGLMLNRNDFSMEGRDTENGSHFIIYSLSGKVIPTGDTQVLRLSDSSASLLCAEASDKMAEGVSVKVADVADGISNVKSEAADGTFKFVENGRLVIRTAHGTFNAAGERIK